MNQDDDDRLTSGDMPAEPPAASATPDAAEDFDSVFDTLFSNSPARYAASDDDADIPPRPRHAKPAAPVPAPPAPPALPPPAPRNEETPAAPVQEESRFAPSAAAGFSAHGGEEASREADSADISADAADTAAADDAADAAADVADAPTRRAHARGKRKKTQEHADILHAARPRLASIVTCVIFGILFLILAAVAFRLGVCTNAGQAFDAIAWQSMASDVPGASALQAALGTSALMLGGAGVIVAAALSISAARRRWSCLVQIVVYMALVLVTIWLLKAALVRPLFDVQRPDPTNSAPSGHELFVSAAFIALLMAVPRVWRALTALIGAAASIITAECLIAGQWHRPTDVIMSLLISAGLAFLVLAFTRGTGLDDLSTRRASPSVQIVSPALIVLGVLFTCYGVYGILQIGSDLDEQPQWASGIVCMAALCLIAGVSCVAFGLLAAMRQLTASPLTGSGIFGTPPRPPRKPKTLSAPSPDAAFAPGKSLGV